MNNFLNKFKKRKIRYYFFTFMLNGGINNGVMSSDNGFDVQRLCNVLETSNFLLLSFKEINKKDYLSINNHHVNNKQ